ncbi:MAG: hypothetical protein K5906_04330 [Bacilli bacterium]|nr:hypothetical protein [Bacilli bacterium]
MSFELPDDTQFEPKKFLIFNIAIIVIIPVISVFITAGAYIVGLVLGILAAIALVILLFVYGGPVVAIIALVLIGALAGGLGAAINAAGNTIEKVAAIIAMAIPTVICFLLGIQMLKSAGAYSEKRVVVSAYITAATYLAAIIMFIVSAVIVATSKESGIGSNNPYLIGMIIPSIARLVYTIFAYKEKNA